MGKKKRVYKDDYEEDRVGWNPEITQGVLAILLFLAAGLAVLSFFEAAGIIGKFFNDFLALLFGVVRFLVPLLLAVVALLLLRERREEEYEYRPTHYLGALLFLLALNGMIHMRIPLVDMVEQALEGYGGGLFGVALAWPLMKFTGFWAAVIILLALLLISLLFLFNTSLMRLISIHKAALRGLGGIGDLVLAFPRLFQRKNVKVRGDYEDFGDEVDASAPKFSSRAIDEEDEDDETDEESVEATEAEDEVEEEFEEEVEEEMEKKQRRSYKSLPKLDLLFQLNSKPTSGDIQANAAIIKETLGNFGIEVDMGEVRVGPTITQYSLKPARGVKLSRITALNNDLSLALAAHPVRIEAPIPGQSLVGIEVPNQRVAIVSLRELLSSRAYAQRPNDLYVALGKDVAGKAWFADLPRMPHLLLAGATGSGKTVCTNTILLSLLFQNTPDTLRLILVDPKRVELTPYNGIPHLLTPVITDVKKTISALKWCISEMERRFELLSKVESRDIASYNKKAPEPLPYIVFVIDEMADLMSAAGVEIEAGVIRIAQMARAVGIHLILATQRPSTDVITGLIKANIPGRIAFSVASLVDSRTILDSSGAEKLLGRGDMLFISSELSKPVRIQGAFVSEEEMKRVINYWKTDEPPEYDEAIVEQGGGASVSVFGGASGSEDPLFLEAKQLIVESGKASASYLQRRLKVGYARAARLLDELEAAGIVGPADGAKPRDILVKDMEDAEIVEDRKYFDDDEEESGDEDTDAEEEGEETEEEDAGEEDEEEESGDEEENQKDENT